MNGLLHLKDLELPKELNKNITETLYIPSKEDSVLDETFIEKTLANYNRSVRYIKPIETSYPST